MCVCVFVCVCVCMCVRVSLNPLEYELCVYEKEETTEDGCVRGSGCVRESV